MGWRLLQALVAGLVLSANVYWQWTPNGYLAAAWAGMAAVAVSWLIGKLLDWRKYGLSVVLGCKERSNQTAQPRSTATASRSLISEVRANRPR